jgi:hypothetical protein
LQLGNAFDLLTLLFQQLIPPSEGDWTSRRYGAQRRSGFVRVAPTSIKGGVQRFVMSEAIAVVRS